MKISREMQDVLDGHRNGQPRANKHDAVCLEDFRAYMPMHNYVFTSTRELWPAASINARIPPMRIGTDENNEPIFMAASTWLDKNQPVEQMTWAPGEPMLIADRLISASKRYADAPQARTRARQADNLACEPVAFPTRRLVAYSSL